MTEEQTHSQVHAVFGLRVGQELRDLFLGRSEGEDVQLSEVFLAKRWGQKNGDGGADVGAVPGVLIRASSMM